MDEEQSDWSGARLHAVLGEVLDVYPSPHVQPDNNFDVEFYEALRHHLDQAYNILADLNAPPPHYLGQKNLDKTQARMDAAADRVIALTELAGQNPQPAPHRELVDLIPEGLLVGQHCDYEDAAIARAYRGYASPSLSEHGPDWPPFDTAALVEQCVASRVLDERTEGDQHDRVVVRGKQAFVYPSGALWLVELVQGLVTLMYAQDCCNYIGSGPGKRERTRQLVTLQYFPWLRARHPDDANLADEELTELVHYETERSLFDSEFAKIQRLRTRFTLLYDLLGLALLLDPTWTTSNCTHVSGPSLAALEDFHSAVARDDDLIDLRNERAWISRHTLRSLVQHMVPGHDLTAYVDHFSIGAGPSALSNILLGTERTLVLARSASVTFNQLPSAWFQSSPVAMSSRFPPRRPMRGRKR